MNGKWCERERNYVSDVYDECKTCPIKCKEKKDAPKK